MEKQLQMVDRLQTVLRIDYDAIWIEACRWEIYDTGLRENTRKERQE